MKDIGVILASRGRHRMCRKVLNMLYTQCESEDNFDVLGIVDKDQVKSYTYVMNGFPQVKWVHPDHIITSWQNIVDEQEKFVKENDYYFIWVLTDDFEGLEPNWDRHILDKKGTFDDGVFAMFQSHPNFMGRHPWVNEKCYILDDDPRWTPRLRGWSDGRVILRHCELLPIYTKKWLEFLFPLMKNDRYTNMPELLTAGLVFLLKKEHNIQRFIQCGISYSNAVNQGKSNKIMTDGLTRDKAWEKMVDENNFSDLRPIIDNILKEIKHD